MTARADFSPDVQLSADEFRELGQRYGTLRRASVASVQQVYTDPWEGASWTGWRSRRGPSRFRIQVRVTARKQLRKVK